MMYDYKLNLTDYSHGLARGSSQSKGKEPTMEDKNALAKAELYSSIMHMSRSAIYDQLTSSYGEKFTAEEAQYAVDNLPQ